jgi:Xaa-Pro aminopeptidase
LCEATKPVRLGEGYEQRFPQGCVVKVAGREQDSAGDEDLISADEEADPPSGGIDEENFAAPYDKDVAAADPAQLAAGRQARLRAVAAQLGVRAFYLRNTSDIKWLTGIDGVFDEERAHALLVADGVACLHTDSRYSNALRNKVQQGGIPLDVSDERISHIEFAKRLIAGEGDELEGKLAIEDSITYAEYAKLVEAIGVDSLEATSNVVLGLRAVKDAPELSRLLAAQAVTDAAFVHIVSFMRPGMTEREVQIELEDYMLRHGGEGLAFSSIVATGANGADPHAIPGKARLEAGQCVVIDFGAKAYGYCSDMTRVVFLGKPDTRLADAWEVLRRANEEVEAFLKPGVTGKQAHELAERVLAEGGFEGRMGHGLGHGVGIDVHEQPVLNPRNDAPLVAGNVVTVEPGIYLPGEFGMRLEDCGVVTSRGYEVFTQLGHEMVII